MKEPDKSMKVIEYDLNTLRIFDALEGLKIPKERQDVTMRIVFGNDYSD